MVRLVRFCDLVRGADHANSRSAAHERAVANTLRWADEAAERREYREALEWLEMLNAIGATMPAGYEAKRTAWLAASGAGGKVIRPRHAPHRGEGRAGL